MVSAGGRGRDRAALPRGLRGSRARCPRSLGSPGTAAGGGRWKGRRGCGGVGEVVPGGAGLWGSGLALKHGAFPEARSLPVPPAQGVARHWELWSQK